MGVGALRKATRAVCVVVFYFHFSVLACRGRSTNNPPTRALGVWKSWEVAARRTRLTHSTFNVESTRGSGVIRKNMGAVCFFHTSPPFTPRRRHAAPHPALQTPLLRYSSTAARHRGASGEPSSRRGCGSVSGGRPHPSPSRALSGAGLVAGASPPAPPHPAPTHAPTSPTCACWSGWEEVGGGSANVGRQRGGRPPRRRLALSFLSRPRPPNCRAGPVFLAPHAELHAPLIGAGKGDVLGRACVGGLSKRKTRDARLLPVPPPHPTQTTTTTPPHQHGPRNHAQEDLALMISHTKRGRRPARSPAPSAARGTAGGGGSGDDGEGA